MSVDLLSPAKYVSGRETDVREGCECGTMHTTSVVLEEKRVESASSRLVRLAAATDRGASTPKVLANGTLSSSMCEVEENTCREVFTRQQQARVWCPAAKTCRAA